MSVKVAGDTLGGGVLNHEQFENTTVFRLQPIEFRIIGAQYACMIKVSIDPFTNETKTAEIDNESMAVELFTGKGEAYVPAMAVNMRAMTTVPVLAVGKGDVCVDFTAGKH